MNGQKILIIDPDKTERLTITQYLEDANYQVFCAEEETLIYQILEKENIELVLLDIDANGISLLEQIILLYPGVRIIAISAHHNIAEAVNAMKLGAMDFLEKPHDYLNKPLSRETVQTLVLEALSRSFPAHGEHLDYDSLMTTAQEQFKDKNYETAQKLAKEALIIQPSRPDALNLLGEIIEKKGNTLEAIKLYRAAFDLDPTYEPARNNLDQATTFKQNYPRFTY
ncbi:probable two-component response regulator [Crocosphaera subtropica ATCC 51142]|uniref:Probable two-component response regulator n=1 Tax=Crocosphaera subtropica (strain ATCC 51142 / BH68) TaxID=43989 RepID=B1WPS3_CROS5|nr:response regulator [Crocosphaera subtropica]ACB53238.1 probable two-component response regulator [Crocosphaera subtropica ATCC 51142]